MSDRNIFVKDQFPSFFYAEGELLLTFVKYYYEWLETTDQVIDIAKKMDEYRDVDTVPEAFYKFLKREFMQNIPATHLADRSILLKNIKDFYRAKGSEKSYELLFRALYDDEVEFYYPGRDILRASDGKWIEETYINVEILIPEANFVNVCFVVGQSSGARGRVSRLLNIKESGSYVYRLYYNPTSGTFQDNENLICIISNAPIATTTSTPTVQDGYFKNTDGFLSSDKKIQDSLYYQEYSYVARSTLPIDIYRNTINDLVHPVGTKLFGEILIKPIIFGTSGLEDDIIVSDYEIDFEFVADQGALFDVDFLLTLGGAANNFTLSYYFDMNAAPANGDFAIATLNEPYAENYVNSYFDVANSAAIAPMYDVKLVNIFNIPLQHFSTNRFLFSTNSMSQLEATRSAGEILDVVDTTNANTLQVVSAVVSNTILYIRDEYQYGETANVYVESVWAEV